MPEDKPSWIKDPSAAIKQGIGDTAGYWYVQGGNAIKRQLNRFGLNLKYRTPKGETLIVRQQAYLATLFDRLSTRIKGLKDIELKWTICGENRKELVQQYLELGIHADEERHTTELEIARDGTDLKTVEKTETYKDTNVNFSIKKPTRILKGYGDGSVESYFCYGKSEANNITTEMNATFQNTIGTIGNRENLDQTASSVVTNLTSLYSQLVTGDSAIVKNILLLEDSEFSYLENRKGKFEIIKRTLKTIRDKATPQYVEFKHTYKVIRDQIMVDGFVCPLCDEKRKEYEKKILDGKADELTDEELYFQIGTLRKADETCVNNHTPNKAQLTDEFKIKVPLTFKEAVEKKIEDLRDFVVREGEEEAGKDKYGRPLEVEQDGDNYIVLIDKWNDTLEYPQRELINKKIKETITKLGSNKWRRVPKEWVRDLDPLEETSYINNEWDAYRDDYRDGRYHPNSRCQIDYTFARRSGLDDLYHDDIINGEYDMTIKIDGEEKKLSKYMIDPHLRDNPKGKLLRRPSHLSPAFDKKAIDFVVRDGNQHTARNDWRHWGRKYYWSFPTPNDLNSASENPDPILSTRGLSKYLIESAIEQSFTIEEARKALRGPSYDYGIRDFGDNGLFPTDPLGGQLINYKRGKEKEAPPDLGTVSSAISNLKRESGISDMK